MANIEITHPIVKTDLFYEQMPILQDCGFGLVNVYIEEGTTDAPQTFQVGEDEFEEQLIPAYVYTVYEFRLQQPVTAAKTLSAIKDYITEKIKDYDKSSDVNSFTIAGYKTWFSVDKRNSLTHSVTTWKNAGNATYDLILSDYGVTLTIDCDELLSILEDLENYAVACFAATSKHLITVQDLDDIELVAKYDYTTDYPAPLSFTI